MMERIKFYKTGVYGFGFFMLLSVFFWSCKNESLTAKQIVEQTVEAHGGLDNWKNIKQLSFDKKVTLFSENGAVERETNQFQLFQWQKPFGKIEWEESGVSQMILFENKTIKKIENDSIISSPSVIDNAKRAFFASEFVIKQPYDLLNENVILTREKDTVINTKSYYIISVSYKNEAKDADRWHYVIDKESSEIFANKVVLKDHTSWVENLTFDTETNFKFNAHRKSYRLNAAGEKTYLRAEYFYQDFSIIKN